MTTSAELDEIIRNAESLTKDEQMQLILHLAKKPQLVHHADFLFSFVAKIKRSHVGYIDEESFTGTWAYDQIWASLRSYSMDQVGGEKAFKLKQTGPKGHFPNGFKFGPKDGKPIFAMVMRHYGQDDEEADQMEQSEIKGFFEDGVQVVWEVDVDNGCSIRVYRSTNPDNSTLYRMGEIAEAEPALPGWRMAVSELPYHQDVGILGTTTLSNWNVAPSDRLAIPGKAEIVRGALMYSSLAGGLSGWASDQIFTSLREYAERTKTGIAVGDNKAFLVDLPGRKSFSPNVAFHTGKMRSGYYHGAPMFAVEVKNGLDYSNEGWGRASAKRSDYFQAGTQVVWDVDVLVDGKVWVNRKDKPYEPTVYGRGEILDAEPVLPGWRMPVDSLFYPNMDNVEA